MLKYNNTHIFTGYLKQLLSTFNLPTCKVYTSEFAKYFEQHGKEDPRVLESFDNINGGHAGVRISYLKNSELYRYFSTKPELAPSGGEKTTWERNSKKCIWQRNTKLHYDSNKNVAGLTKTLNSPGINYDTKTHEYLGEYLRFIRDYYNVNLMSLYNCFNDKIYNNIEFNFTINTAQEKTTKITFNSQNPKYRIYAVPVKLFEQYTIAIDCDQGIELFCGLYNTTLEMSSKADDLARRTYQKIHKTLFNQPFLYDKLDTKHWGAEADFSKDKSTIRTDVFTRWDIINREKDLKLFIKVPVSCRSTITILEGDFRTFNNALYSSTKGTLRGKYDETPITTWRYDETLKTFKTNLDNKDYILGAAADNAFTGIGPVEAESASVCAHFIDSNVTDNLSLDNITEPEVGGVYKLVFYYDSIKTLKFLNSTMCSPDHFAVTELLAESPNIQIEKTGRMDNEYYLVCTVNGKKQYLNIATRNKITELVYQNNHSILNFNTTKLSTNANNFGDGIELNSYTFKPISKLQLLAFNTGESYPFADRLIEYLSNSAITPMDEIPDNIKRVQHVMKNNKSYFKIEGLWEPKMQNILYDYVMNSGPITVIDGKLVDKRQGYQRSLGHVSKSNLYDILGYVDKDTENWYVSWKKDSNKESVAVSLQNVDIYVDENGKSLWDI